MIKFITVWILAVQYIGSNQESHGFTTTHQTQAECLQAKKQVKTGAFGTASCIKGSVPVVVK